MAFNAKADAAEKRAMAAKLLQQAADEDNATPAVVAPVATTPVVTIEATIAGDKRNTAQPSLFQTIMSVARRFR